MLFLNTQPVDRNCCAKYGRGRRISSSDDESYIPGSDGYGDGECRHLLKATIILILIYFITSVGLCVLHVPISLCILLLPVIIFICAAVAAHTRAVNRLWLCCIAATLGTFGKILAIIIYSMVFGYSGIDDEYGLSPGTSKQRRAGTRHSDNDYMRFFVALLIAETLLIALCVCAARFCKKCLR